MGWTFHLAFRIVSLQANAAFPAEGNGLDISPGLKFHVACRIVSLQVNLSRIYDVIYRTCAPEYFLYIS